MIASTLVLPFVGCFGHFCAPCTYGQTSEIVGEGSCFTQALMVICCSPCVQCCMAPARRAKLRGAFELDETQGMTSPMGDCLTWVCCPNCANCQEARELKVTERMHTQHASTVDCC